MITLYGKESVQNSEQAAVYGSENMIPALRGGTYGAVAAKKLFAPNFQRYSGYQSVTRDPEDTLVHTHSNHVLLLRSASEIPDDTLICEYTEGLRAQARAAIETDILHKISRHPTGVADHLDELMENLHTAISFLLAGLREDETPLLIAGQEKLRRELQVGARYLPTDIKFELYKMFVSGHHQIDPQLRSVLDWDEEELDALLIRAHQGHARSLLHVDYNKADSDEFTRAFGGLEHPLNRGLHFVTYPAS